MNINRSNNPLLISNINITIISVYKNIRTSPKITIKIIMPTRRPNRRNTNIFRTTRPNQRLKPMLRHLRVHFQMKIIIQNIQTKIKLNSTRINRRRHRQFQNRQKTIINISHRPIPVSLLLISNINRRLLNRLNQLAPNSRPTSSMAKMSISSTMRMRMNPLHQAIRLNSVPEPRLIENFDSRFKLLADQVNHLKTTFPRLTANPRRPMRNQRQTRMRTLIRRSHISLNQHRIGRPLAIRRPRGLNFLLSHRNTQLPLTNLRQHNQFQKLTIIPMITKPQPTRHLTNNHRPRRQNRLRSHLISRNYSSLLLIRV